MSKVVLLLSLLGISILFSLGLTDPDNPIIWLASTTLNFAYLRLAMMVALASLLMTHPPRNVYLRMTIGVFVTMLAGWSLYSTYSNQLMLLDSLAILQFCVSAGLAILEKEENAPVPQTIEQRIEAARKARMALSS